jgi:hypothetical protein
VEGVRQAEGTAVRGPLQDLLCPLQDKGTVGMGKEGSCREGPGAVIHAGVTLLHGHPLIASAVLFFIQCCRLGGTR